LHTFQFLLPYIQNLFNSKQKIKGFFKKFLKIIEYCAIFD